VRAELDDLDALVPLFDAYRRFYGQASDLGGARAFLADRFKRGESVIFLAVVDGAIVGLHPALPLVLIGLDEAPLGPERSLRNAGRAQVGAGRALLERAERWAAETGAKGLRLSTQITNRGAQRLYEACGWTKDDEYLHYHRLF